MTKKDLELIVFYSLLLLTVALGVIFWRCGASHNTVTGTCDTLYPTATRPVFIDSDIAKDDSVAIYNSSICASQKCVS